MSCAIRWNQSRTRLAALAGGVAISLAGWTAQAQEPAADDQPQDKPAITAESEPVANGLSTG